MIALTGWANDDAVIVAATELAATLGDDPNHTVAAAALADDASVNKLAAILQSGQRVAFLLGSSALREPALLVTLKTVLHPLIVWVLATQVFDVPPLWVATGVLLAALPAGITPYLFAQRYGACQSTVASAVFLSTLVSVGTLSALLFVLRP